MYVGGGAFQTCSQFAELGDKDASKSEFQNWTYGYWSARNHVNSYSGKEIKNLSHPSVIGAAFFDSMRTQCLGQQNVMMIAIIQEVFSGLPPYKP